MKIAAHVLVLGLFTAPALAGPPTHCGDGRAALAIDVAKQAIANDPVRALDPELAHYLALAFPTGLDFDSNKPAVKDASVKRFTAWFVAKTDAQQVLAGKYGALLATATWPQQIAAAARLGQVTEQFAELLLTAEVPADIRRGQFPAEATEAYCDALADKAQVILTSSLEKYKACAERATRLAVKNEWSKLCDARVAALTATP
jgi:hypothetical protein